VKVAITALGPDLGDLVDERFGRARFVLVVDTETSDLEAVDNAEQRNALQGAGIGAAELVAGRGAGAVVTGHLGPKAFDALQAAGIAGYDGAGRTAADALEAFKEGRLERLEHAGHAHAGLG